MNERKQPVSEQPPVQPEEILNRPVANVDLASELKKNKRSFGKVTLGLGGAVLLVGAFFGGVATHAAVAKPAPAAAAQNGRQPGTGRFGGGQGGGTGQGQNGQGNPGGFRGGTAGTIDHVDGTDVYVKTQDGKVVKVSTSDTTQVRITQQGKLSDLKNGQNVIVQGQTGQDGTVSAQAITEGQFRPGQG
jgi:hypothetical protein